MANSQLTAGNTAVRDHTDNKWMAAISVFTGAVMGTIDTFVLYVATPHLRGVFSATTAEISWISTSYSVAALICMLLSGWLGTKYGRKRVYQASTLAFVLASALCGMSESLGLIIAARVLQGAAAGIILPTEIVILRQTFPPEQHGKVMGFYGATVMVGPAIGPILGGYIIDNYHWAHIFFINVPIGLLGCLMVGRYVRSDALMQRGQVGRFDWIGAGLLALGIFCLVWLLERGDRLFWFEDSSNLALLWVAASALALFAAHALMTPHPLVDLRVLKTKTYTLAVVMNFLLYFVVTGTLFILPVYMQDLLGFSPSKAGTVMAPRALVMMMAFPVVGFLFNRVKPKLLICTGLVIGVYSGALMIGFTHDTGMHDMLTPLVMQGLAVVLVLMPLTNLGLMHIAPAKLAAAAGLEATARQLGGSLGVAAFASLLTHFELSSWAVLRPSVSFAYPVFFKRFGIVMDTIMLDVPSRYVAFEQALRVLNGRVQEQVLALSYRNMFQVVAACFITLLVVALICDLRKPSTQ